MHDFLCCRAFSNAGVKFQRIHWIQFAEYDRENQTTDKDIQGNNNNKLGENETMQGKCFKFAH